MDKSPYERQVPIVPAAAELPWDMTQKAGMLDRSRQAPLRPRRPGLY